jgi:hypothetical protein
MKKTILGLFLIGFMVQSYAQQNDVLFKAKLNKEEMPVAIVENVSQDFPDLVVEEFDAVPLEFVEDDVIIDRSIESNNDYDTYQVILKGKNESLVATYNKDGKLISTVEHGKNVELPISVENAVEKDFPRWVITEDHYKMIHYKNKTKIDRYKLIIKKGKNTKKIYFDASGNILKVHEENLMAKI